MYNTTLPSARERQLKHEGRLTLLSIFFLFFSLSWTKKSECDIIMSHNFLGKRGHRVLQSLGSYKLLHNRNTTIILLIDHHVI